MRNSCLMQQVSQQPLAKLAAICSFFRSPVEFNVIDTCTTQISTLCNQHHSRLSALNLSAFSIRLCFMSGKKMIRSIERLQLTSPAVKQPKHRQVRYTPKTVWQESSNFYSYLRNASSLELTKYYCVNFRCSAVTMPIRSSSYTTWNTSETA